EPPGNSSIALRSDPAASAGSARFAQSMNLAANSLSSSGRPGAPRLTITASLSCSPAVVTTVKSAAGEDGDGTEAFAAHPFKKIRKQAPQSAYEAKFSGPYTVASAMIGGTSLGLGIDDFTDAHAARFDRSRPPSTRASTCWPTSL